MNLFELREYKSRVQSEKLKKFVDVDITEAIKNNRESTYYELMQISSYVSLNDKKTENQIQLINTTDMPFALKTYRFLNPYVGAVMLKKKGDLYYICGCCRNANNNDEHAEFTLIKEIIKDNDYDKEDVLFTTLEPCTKISRQRWSTSCSDLIVQSNIKNVYIGSLDPNPLITGIGLKFLLDNNVNILFYLKDIRDMIQENNKVFLNQFELPKGDPQKYKDIFDSFYDYLDYDTVEKYIALTIGKINSISEFSKYEERSNGEKYRNIFEFFREMVLNKSILLADREVNKFVCTNDFALFFFNEPKKIVDGASIRVISNISGTEKIFDCSLYQIFDKIAEIMKNEYVIEFGTKPSKHSKLNYVEQTFKQIEEKFNKNLRKDLNESIIKELLINAIVHRDYNSPAFTEIIIDNHYIEFRNPITPNISKDIDIISKYSYGSRPINSRLMRFFMDIKYCERKSYGMKLAEKYKIIYKTSEKNTSILIARLEKHEK
ncbi:MAG: hypothetical protein PHY08_11190 [Candidatus Cloacimonetes bacterium]|nr:hypothetical protein [Candidatus Cloacimonadota bacterium]